MMVLKSHLEHKHFQNGIFERSPLSCQNVFGKILFEDKLLDELEWELCNSYYYDYGWIPDVVIYLQLDPQTCLQRIKKRNRPGEEDISIDYITKLHNKYEETYLKNNNINMKVIIIDGSKSKEEIFQDVKDKIINRIRFSTRRINDFSFH